MERGSCLPCARCGSERCVRLLLTVAVLGGRRLLSEPSEAGADHTGLVGEDDGLDAVAEV
jgi:hypothetical protein